MAEKLLRQLPSTTPDGTTVLDSVILEIVWYAVEWQGSVHAAKAKEWADRLNQFRTELIAAPEVP